MRIQSVPARAAGLLLALFSASSIASAVETRVWQQDSLDEFTKSTVKNLSIRSDGRVTLAPAFRELADTATPYLWDVVEDSRGVLYCAGGAPTGSTAKVFAIPPQGKMKVFAELSALEIHALAVDRQNRIYAATSPDSKVYRIGQDGKAELFFDTKAKYVWSLLFDQSGNLYVATGDQGIIYRVSPDGKGSEFFRTDETHARSMILDSKGNLIVGTDPGGYILRITPAGKSFVLFQSGKRELSALAERGGVLYAAATGGRPSQPPVLAPNPPPPPAPPTTPTTKTSVVVQAAPSTPPPAPSVSLLTPGSASAGGSDFYRLGEDGSAEKLWSSTIDVVYAIGFDVEGKPILGTGNKGLVYRIDSANLATQLVNAPPTQVTAFHTGRNGILYAVTGNVGKVYAIGPGLEKSGSLESEPLDAGSFSIWGKAHLLADLDGGAATITTRSGNVSRPQKNWSDWAPVDLTAIGGQVISPPARFLQYRLALSASPRGKSPGISAVQIAYLPKNIAPAIRVVQVEQPNYRAAASTNYLERSATPSGLPLSMSLPPLEQQRKTNPLALETSSGVTVQYAKGYITVRWSASDENQDSLEYRVEICGKGESVWRLLKDRVQEKYFSFDGSAFPDGEYVLRLTTSDAPSNTPSEALSSSLESDPFIIDNTPPQIVSNGTRQENGRTIFSFSVKDALSWIDKAEYSINAGEWIVLSPTNRVSDSQNLSYEVPVPPAQGGVQQVLAIRVFDDNDNESVTKVLVP
jgi:hypothetical protein